MSSINKEVVETGVRLTVSSTIRKRNSYHRGKDLQEGSVEGTDLANSPQVTRKILTNQTGKYLQQP